VTPPATPPTTDFATVRAADSAEIGRNHRPDGGKVEKRGDGGNAEAVGERDPLTERGRRTRESLLVAARETFEAKGYPGTRMGDIADAAGVAHGTVYTYFPDKAAVFRAVAHDLSARLETEWKVRPEDPDPVVRIADANRRFFDSFIAHGMLWQVIEQVGVNEPEYAALFSDFRQRYVERAVAGIRKLQREGLVAKDLDAYLAGSALCAMVEGFGRQWHGRAEEHDSQVVSDTLTRLWAQALGLQPTNQLAGK